MRTLLLSFGLVATFVAGVHAYVDEAELAKPAESIHALGKKLFNDQNLSANRTQSCATCHDPKMAFVDPRGMASTGDDGISLGDRNAPTITYAAFVPPFHRSQNGEWVGGQFRDGRARHLEAQAAGPPLAPGEMAMPDKAAVVDRLRENPDYVYAFEIIFGTGVLDDDEQGYSAMARAIAAYQRTPTFNSFDSKYDHFLRGEVELTREEELGRVLFFSPHLTNCSLCHQVSASATNPREVFTNHAYHNVGTPENTALRALNGVPLGTIDEGLAANQMIGGDPAQRGKFRTPTLRNVAVTGPYMSNGVFRDLRTVVLFYNVYNARSEAQLINPETGEPFGLPPVPDTISLKELTDAPTLEDHEIDALVAFLETLTDARYEHLLKE